MIIHKWLRWFKSLFAWKQIRNTGVWLYEENTVTGKRRATLINTGCWQPMDRTFMRKGDKVRQYNGEYVIGTDDEIRYTAN